MFTDFDNWGESNFWPAISSSFGISKSGAATKLKSALQVEVSSGLRASTLGLQLQESLVLENNVLTSPDVPVKRLVKFKLPSDMTYQCGDYLAILPVNPSNVVRRAIRRFGLPWDAVLQIQKTGWSTPPMIPLDVSISAFDLLSTYVELSQPASKRDINVLAEAAAADTDTQAKLQYLASSPAAFTEEIIKKRVSPLDLLLRYPAIQLPIGDYLMMLPPMRVRQYSISSSPLCDPSECTVTLSVLDAPSLSATGDEQFDDEERYLGVASTYLSSLKAGDRVDVSVRPSNTGFRPPMDLKTPIIMACAGSGLAPFRGFVMDRAEKIRGRRNSISQASSSPDLKEPAKAFLYVGCRTKGKDDIHATELAECQSVGAVEVRWAYSRPEDGSKSQHIQDLMLADYRELLELFQSGARIYVCGSTGVSNAVRGACKEIFLSERHKIGGAGTAEDTEDHYMAADKFFESLRAKQRFMTDVFT
jgi:cytochrome P450/NADPH-cytochrome P450 reductase